VTGSSPINLIKRTKPNTDNAMKRTALTWMENNPTTGPVCAGGKISSSKENFFN
jgi:hypothetical protein